MVLCIDAGTVFKTGSEVKHDMKNKNLLVKYPFNRMWKYQIKGA